MGAYQMPFAFKVKCVIDVYCNSSHRAICLLFSFHHYDNPCFYPLSGMYHRGDVVSLFCHVIGCFLPAIPIHTHSAPRLLNDNASSPAVATTKCAEMII